MATNTHRRITQIAAALFASVIIYGSLYPFQFVSSLTLPDALSVFGDSWRNPADRYDLVANVLFYMPLGFCMWRALRLPRLLRCLAVIFFGLALSFSLEMAQFYVDGRFPSFWDLVGNGVGTIFGTAVSVALQRGNRWPLGVSIAARPYVTLLLLSWVAFVLCPSTQIVGVLQSWVTPTKLPEADPAWLAIYSQLVVIWVLALLLEEVVGLPWRRMAILYFAAPFQLAAILTHQYTFSPFDIVAATLGVLLWIFVLWKTSIRSFVVALLYLGCVVSERLQPFHFTAPRQTVHWIPLYGLIIAPPETAILFFLHNLFTLGVLPWLLVRAGLRLGVATLAGCLFLAVLLASETFVSYTWTEISDVFMLVGLAVLMKLSGESTLSQA